MLKKLLKHEWNYFWKIPATINLCLILLVLIGIGFLASPLLTLEYDFINALAMFGFILYYLAIISGSIGVCIYSAVRYYKSVYTDEGYLVHTLPVTPRQIVLSKLFISVIWNIITSIVICSSIMLLITCAMNIYGDFNLWSELIAAWEELVMITGGTMSLFLFILAIFLSIIISPFFSILMLYSSIGLGQLFKKHKVAGAVIWYIAEYMIMQFITALIINVPLFTGLMTAEMNDRSPITIINPVIYGTLLLSVISTIGLYFLTEYLLSKRLNLD